MAAEEAEILSLTMLNYERSWVVEFFHKFPHFDFSFQPINSTFDPGNESYTQVLLIWGCVPVLWLALTYLTLFIYMLCQCCVKPTAKVQQITCQKWALVIFGLLCCGVLGVGLYGNESTHRGVHGFADSFQSAEETFQSTENQTLHLRSLFRDDIGADVRGLRTLFERPIANATVADLLVGQLDLMTREVDSMVSRLDVVANRTAGVDLNKVPEETRQCEKIRWVTNMCLQWWQIVLCVLVFLAIGRSARGTSRGMLISFAALAVFTLLICWGQAGLYMAGSVGLGDLCVDPRLFIEKQTAPNVEDDVLSYYVECDAQQENPFASDLAEAEKTIGDIRDALAVIAREAEPFYLPSDLEPLVASLGGHLNETAAGVQLLRVLLDCHRVHADLMKSLSAVCSTAIVGVAFMLVAAAAAGLIFTVMICIVSKAWLNVHKQRGYYAVDEDDPFLPRQTEVENRYGSLVGGSNPQPVYVASAAGQASAPSHQSLASTVPDDNSPPPAYDGHHMNYMHQGSSHAGGQYAGAHV